MKYTSFFHEIDSDGGESEYVIHHFHRFYSSRRTIFVFIQRVFPCISRNLVPHDRKHRMVSFYNLVVVMDRRMSRKIQMQAHIFLSPIVGWSYRTIWSTTQSFQQCCLDVTLFLTSSYFPSYSFVSTLPATLAFLGTLSLVSFIQFALCGHHRTAQVRSSAFASPKAVDCRSSVFCARRCLESRISIWRQCAGRHSLLLRYRRQCSLGFSITFFMPSGFSYFHFQLCLDECTMVLIGLGIQQEELPLDSG